MKRFKYGIIGVCSSYGCHINGAEKGPRYLNKNGLISELNNYGVDIRDYGYCEVTDVQKSLNQNDKLKNINQVCEIDRQIYYKVINILNNNEVPIIIGGDHSLSAGSVMAVSEKYENLGVIWIDAHADFNDENITNTGNMHGMPLSALSGYGPECMISYSKHKFIKKQNIILIGGRDYEPKEKEKLDKFNIKYYTMKEINDKGIDEVLRELIEYLSLKNIKNVHVSFDIDSLSPEIAPGTSVPVYNGFQYENIIHIFDKICSSLNMVSVDIVEFNPLLDVNNKTCVIINNILKFITTKNEH